MVSTNRSARACRQRSLPRRMLAHDITVAVGGWYTLLPGVQDINDTGDYTITLALSPGGGEEASVQLPFGDVEVGVGLGRHLARAAEGLRVGIGAG